MAYGVFTARSLNVCSETYRYRDECGIWLSSLDLCLGAFEMGDSGRYLIYLIFLVAVSDTGAYFAVRLLKAQTRSNLSLIRPWRACSLG